jgi:tetratricopeptide (TPR) repeat protein
MCRRSRSSSNRRALGSPHVLAAVIVASLAGGAAWANRARAQAPTAFSAPVALAEQYAAQAFEAYQRRDYGRAVQLYEQALSAAPSADILYNIARVCDLGLSDRRRAIEHYERYVADPGAVTVRLEIARARLAELRAAERNGGGASGPADTRLDIARDFPLDVAEPAPPRDRVDQDRGGLRPLETAALTLGSMGLVGVGIGVGFGLAAQARSDDWRRACDGNACTSREGVDAAESATRRATIATVGFAAGGGLLALGAALWLIDSSSGRSDDDGALSVEPFVGDSGAGTLVSGTF